MIATATTAALPGFPEAATSPDRRPMRCFFAGQVAGQLGDAAAQVTLAQVVVLEIERGASAAAIARVLVTMLIPTLIAGPLAGRIATLGSRGQVLAAAAVLRAGAVATTVISVQHRSLIGAYAAWGVLLVLSRISFAVRTALIASITDCDEFATIDAHSLVLGGLAGPSGAGIGVGLGSWHTNAALGFAASAIMVAGLFFTQVGTPQPGTPQPRRRATRLCIAALREPWPAVRNVWLHRLLLGAQLVGWTLVVDRELGISSAGYAIAAGAIGVGASVGAASAARHGCIVWARMTVRSVLAVNAALMFWTILHTRVPILIATLFCAGATCQLARIAADTAVQAVVEEPALGQAIATVDFGNNVLIGVGGLAALCVCAAFGTTVTMLAVTAVYAALSVQRIKLTVLNAASSALTAHRPNSG